MPLRPAGATGSVPPAAEAAAARPRIGDLLRRQGLADPALIDEALDLHRAADLRLGEALMATGAIGRGDVLRLLEAQWGARHVDLEAAPADPRLVARLGPADCLRLSALPWRRIGSATVIATEDPAGFPELRERLEALYGPVMMALAAPGAVGAAIAAAHAPELALRAETRVPRSLSCRAWRAGPFRTAAAMAAFLFLCAPLLSLAWTCTALLAVASVSLLALCVLKCATLFARPGPAGGAEIHELHGGIRPGRLPVISLLVPLYKEERIALQLVRRLSKLDYPSALLDVCLVVEADDTVTHATLATAELPRWMRVVVVPEGQIKTKPRAMNYALDFCRGSVIGIYDAEDAPEPGQLRQVAERFARAGPRVACLQGCLDYYNTGLNWMSRCFTIEYASWFRVMLPGVAHLGLAVPLGGTTVFFRRGVLEALGGWDSHNVTEDADLGIRLARAGYETEILDMTTWEEANCIAWPWVKQRSRWLKGYAMTYAVHMRQPLRLWRDLGNRRFWGFQAMFLGTLLQFALAPLLWSLWVIPFGLWHPVREVIPDAAMAGLALFFGLSEIVMVVMAALALRRTGRLRLLPWAFTLPVYFLLASMAMYKALAEMVQKPFYWDKTQHGKFGGAIQGGAALKVIRGGSKKAAA
ncbi:glycosyltransferase [Poseidonocella sp. HB161398]|uniref:glycosyltransferase n=1 Tax=Poseidonocella sp. HB161398 TaxID=2320855 RepID=UPI00148664A5|nr:glycosyltransferase [Poseidonocella sp. HB161398]